MEWRREKPTLIKHLFDILEPDDIPHVFVYVCVCVYVQQNKKTYWRQTFQGYIKQIYG